MNILLIGLGSIGARHLKNIIESGYSNIAAVTSLKKLPEEFKQVTIFNSIQQACISTLYNAVIVCSPTSQHIINLQELMRYNIPSIYLEKPVSHNYEGVEELLISTNLSQKKIVVGYDLHFDLGLQKIKRLLDENTLGKIISINATVGQYLPDWRPNQDYSQTMSAKKITGGGVMLDLVHEFDYLYWLAGNTNTIAAHYMHSGTLNIETEDAAEVLIKFKNGALATIHLDYLQPQLVRNCHITCSHGSIFWNMAENNVKWINRQKQTFEYSYKEFQRNDRFSAIMKAFLDGAQDNRLTSFQDALVSLKMVLAAKHSSENQVFVQMDKFSA